MATPYHQLFLITILVLAEITSSEYIPPGPAFPCPKETDLLYPCVCTKGTDTGIHVSCENTGLSVLSVGLGNIAGLGVPIEKLLLKDCKISRIFGPLFHRSIIRTLYIEGSPLTELDQYTFAGVNRTLQELYLYDTKLTEFPKDAFKILSNLTKLYIDGHAISKLGKDIFSGSEAAGRLEKLHIINGLLSDVAADAFQYLKKLKTLDLHGNRLATLKKSQFKGLRDTEVLDISYNNITKLDGSHIGDLTKLGWCNASHNDIGEIPRGMFARNTVLKVLHLNHNRIKKLDTNSFRGMRFLRRLFLNDNEISDIGRGTFSAVTRIGTVELARNKITKVEYQMFQAAKYAELINLAENEITTIESQAFTDLYLATVNISHNQLNRLEPDAFVNCNNLTTLDLSFNALTQIVPAAFDQNTYAGELLLGYNQFTDLGQIPIANMTGLRLLNASHNRIERIPRNAFPKLYELHTVDVSHNNLSEIYNAVFQSLFSLRYLNLSHNSLEAIKPSTFGTLHTVLELDLSHNRLGEVSRGAMAKLSSCRVLDLSWNKLRNIFQIPVSLGELNFAHNLLPEILPNTWPTMNALLRLNLASNQLQDNLRAHSFSGLLTLQRLDISDNGVTAAPWEALNTMSSLQYLFMQDNALTSLTRSSFGNLPTLFQLDLTNNNISSIEPRSFSGLLQLLQLSLRNNSLQHVPNEAFKTLVSLRRLDLSYNSLEKIDNKTNGLLDDCLSLEMVNLSHNNIGFLTRKMFPSSPWIPYRLQEVDLSHNAIPVLTIDITHGASTLRRLNLASNGINDVRSNVLGNLTSLEELDLSGNKLKDLQSRTSDIKLQLPVNLTSLHLQDNQLETLPAEKLANCSRLRRLDARNNRLETIAPALVRNVRKGTLEVLFDGNQLKCDCQIRPLKHHINHFSQSQLSSDHLYKSLPCHWPPALANQTLLSVDEERLVCGADVKQDGGPEKAYDFVLEPDVAFRDVQYSQPSIYVHWFVLTTEDVADFFIFIRDENNRIYYETTASYTLRSITIDIDNELKTVLKTGKTLELCIQAKNSLDIARKWFPNQCQNLDSDFESWPSKLTIDKRRLTKKKARKYSWFSNNVLGLVSDSILITLCIFLGVCFRRMADLES